MTLGKPLRVLIVEDQEDDVVLVVRVLRAGGFDVTHLRVETPQEMTAALDQSWDIVISDYSMPHLGASRALALLKARGIDLPFIIVSGTVDEETAVASLHAGANDFMSKNRLTRLVPAVERELREAAARAEQARLREHLLVSDRMASVGMLAAGVAHEINNPLAALMANLDFAAQDVGEITNQLRDAGQHDGVAESVASQLDRVDESLQDARECAARVRTIVRDIKMFSHSDEESVDAVDVRRVLESTFRMSFNEIRHRARLVKDYGEVPPVLGNEGRLGQVFLNLVVNAAQAIPVGDAEHNEIRVKTSVDRGRVVIEVRDTGGGIPPSVLPRIFEPFVTTKPAGVGTGLGLAICKRIVTGFGGTIEALSEVGRGTTIKVTLPAADPGLSGRARHTPTPPAARKAKILVVDDEPAIGTAIGRILSRDHDVSTTFNAGAVLARIAAGDRFDVILCDLMMPVLTGMDLYAEVLRVAPEQAERIAFMTGGAFTARAREFLDSVRNPRIEKPFDLGGLMAVLHPFLRAA